MSVEFPRAVLISAILPSPRQPAPKIKLKVGDRVRMFDGRSVGSIDSIEKNKVIVNYGIFTTQINIELLEFVESEKTFK